MAHPVRPVELAFLSSAPVRLVCAAELAAPPDTVYRALAEDVAGTPSWFAAVAAARPTDGGAGREIRLRGGVVFRERILAREPARRYAYRVEETNAPGVTALLEEWALSPAGAGTRVRWTMAADGAAVFRWGLRAGRAGVGRSFRDAMRALDRRLTAHPAP
ncbi:SRPBCC family protein [Streptomyces sp. TRM49041]|uniref:SRPBCC family protein n=1 Tax=Streptomyces sp. TRM49041 TaxID=2603216 RepID=UPI0011F04578|nr:SRPBCC family protein [Streptomyces sp. TRM49041]